MNLFRRLKHVGVGHAADHLERLGFSIVERDVRTPCGDTDLVAHDDARLLFCEVTTRRMGNAARPTKPRPWPPGSEVRRAATTWLLDTEFLSPAVARLRFDSMDVTVNALGQLISLDHRYAEYATTEPTEGER